LAVTVAVDRRRSMSVTSPKEPPGPSEEGRARSAASRSSPKPRLEAWNLSRSSGDEKRQPDGGGGFGNGSPVREQQPAARCYPRHQLLTFVEAETVHLTYAVAPGVRAPRTTPQPSRTRTEPLRIFGGISRLARWVRVRRAAARWRRVVEIDRSKRMRSAQRVGSRGCLTPNPTVGVDPTCPPTGSPASSQSGDGSTRHSPLGIRRAHPGKPDAFRGCHLRSTTPARCRTWSRRGQDRPTPRTSSGVPRVCAARRMRLTSASRPAFGPEQPAPPHRCHFHW
jgi:hypothetical protein